MRRCLITLLCLACGAGLPGCNQARPVQAQVLLNHQNCQAVSKGITPVSVAQVAKIRGSRLLSLDQTKAPSATTDQISDASNGGIDTSNQLESAAPGAVVYAISNGPMPTPGYAFEFVNAQLQELTLTLFVEWHRPDPGALLAQVRTHPCLVIALPSTTATTLVVQEGDTQLARLPL